MGTIADTIRSAISAGKTNEEVLAAVKAAHPDSNTSPACVSYYRSKMKKAGTNLPAAPKAPKQTPIAKATAAAVGHGYTVKGVKSFRGNEGYGFNATLYKDGKAIAFVYDDANGGCYMYEWKDKAAEQPLLELAKQKYPDMKFEQMDAFVGSLIDDVLLEKDAAKLTKGKVAILKDGKIYTIKAPNGTVTPQFLELVAKKNPTAKVLNTAPLSEVVALLKSMSN
ncbi:hypothetical protein vBSmQDWS359_74 [Stenotrophomonas phage vB_Sm_QDWS359]|uniref:Uncharacterized protein n=1 Tax=Stenotrophomonas phage vB_Sm_QDWS359 TaxID=2943841 RepID=A0A9E7DL46_9CAUD|nr:hypothetical protein P9A46_gp48 [Stenotrophomonas phage vB_Sm_QDWS359]UQM93912.1 hypothetical protein vBSmQDWS359_74 [Stenotrophomonas phage vB_Sm_QDWS359]